MLLMIAKMLKKRLGVEGIERDWSWCNNLDDYFKISSTLIIPEDCRRIGYHAFDCYRNLKKVVIPKSVEFIGEEAFYDCWSTTIILKKAENKFNIEYRAFKRCKYVKEEIRS